MNIKLNKCTYAPSIENSCYCKYLSMFTKRIFMFMHFYREKSIIFLGINPANIYTPEIKNAISITNSSELLIYITHGICVFARSTF